MIICNKCKLLQLENNFDANEMYGDNYGYMSSLNSSMVSHLKLKALSLKKKYKPKVIFNLAAETHVDRSIDDPSNFIHTNIDISHC